MFNLFSYFLDDDGEAASGETKTKSNNWMEEAEKRLELLKLRVEKEGKDEDDDDDDWDGLDSSDEDFNSEDDSSS